MALTTPECRALASVGVDAAAGFAGTLGVGAVIRAGVEAAAAAAAGLATGAVAGVLEAGLFQKSVSDMAEERS
jgi:hypothetical protein